MKYRSLILTHLLLLCIRSNTPYVFRYTCSASHLIQFGATIAKTIPGRRFERANKRVGPSHTVGDACSRRVDVWGRRRWSVL